jgi:hypothetical protein
VPVYSLAEAVTDDRTVLYVGTTGGYVQNPQSEYLIQAGGYVQNRQSEHLIQAGVYRYTTIIPDETKIYLPLILRLSP